MKKFTKIALIVAVVLFSVGLVSVIGSFAMGLTWDSLGDMMDKGRFSFDVQSREKEDNGFATVQENFHSLDVEFGYGTLEIKYGDVEKLQIEHESVDKYRCYVEEGALHIEGNLKTKVGIGNQNGEIIIVVPRNMVFQEVDLEFGAGKADVASLKANHVDVELGAGEMNIIGLDSKDFNADTGAGKLYAELVGKQTDYSYNMECGIGQLKVGDSTYSGLGAEQSISNPGAARFMDVECGVGEIVIKFQGQ